MGQYFKAVNIDKRECVNAHLLGHGAKLVEWVTNPHGSVFCLLLRHSDESGGGDIGPPNDADAIVGRWAGDRVLLVGDYASSQYYQLADEEYLDISDEVAEAWNRFVNEPGRRLGYQ